MATEEQREKELQSLLDSITPRNLSLDELYETVQKPVNYSYAPTHYNGWKVGKFIAEQNLNFYEGCVVKYICRHKKKDGLKDLKKAKDYLEQLINEYNTTRT